MTYSDALAYLDAHASYEKTGRIESPTIERMKTIVAAMGDPQFAYPVIHVTGHQRQGFDIADDHPAVDGARADRRHVHQPAPRAAERADEPRRRDHQRRRVRRADRRGRRSRDAHRRSSVVLRGDHRGGVPMVCRSRRRCRRGRGRCARTMGRDQRLRRAGRGRSPTSAWTTTSSPGPTKGHIAAEKAGVIKPGSIVVGRRDRS